MTNTTFLCVFTYDGFGWRVKIVEKLKVTVTGTRHFIWDGLRLSCSPSLRSAVHGLRVGR